MAIAKYVAPLAGLRGTVGGLTYSENLAGPYVKLWSGPSNPRTAGQQVERGFMGSMAELWRATTAAEKIGWNIFAALPAQELTNSLGEAYYISGFGWFCKCNIRLLRVGRTPRSSWPTVARPAAPTIDDFRVCVAGTEVDICTCGVASASNEDPVHLADDAFDNSLASFWGTQAGTTTGWIRYDLCNPANVKRYRLHPRAADQTTAPASWNFQVFSGGGWQTIHAVTGEAGWANQWYDFYCPNAYTETDYRWDITANQGHATRLGLAEIEMYLGDEGSSVVIYPEDEYESTPDWDLILHVSMGNSTGMRVQYPGFYEMLAVQDPGRWYELFQSEVEAVFGTIMENRSWFGRLARQTREGLRSSWATARGETLS